MPRLVSIRGGEWRRGSQTLLLALAAALGIGEAARGAADKPTAEKAAADKAVADKAAASQAPAPAARSSLDQALLDDLDNDLLDGAGKQTPAPKPAAAPADGPKSDAPAGDAGRKPAEPGVDDESMGEDIGQGPEDPIVRIGREMRRVERMIAEQEAARKDAGADAARADQLQQQIVKDLAKLIDQLEQQRQQQSASKRRKKSEQEEQVASRAKIKQQQPGGSKPDGNKSSQGARDSSNELRNRAAQRPDLGDVKGMMKDLWGQLPAHAREQMLQTSPEQFLPRYELQIERYYKRLAEQQKQNP